MRTRKLTTVIGLTIVATLAFTFFLTPASGDAKTELAKAQKKGETLWAQKWGKGKTCAQCHTKGANKLTAKRLNAYPKYDKFIKKVVTAQQKLNQMIKSKGKGEELELGSEDLNALEAYIKTRE